MNRLIRYGTKKFFAAILTLLLIFCCASPAFSFSPLSDADFATKNLTTGPESAPTIIPKDIIGGDNRTKVSDTTVFPFRAIGYIVSTWPKGNSTIGTAWLFKSDAIVTAGHCVYDKDLGGWATRVTFYPGRNGSSTPYGSAYSIEISSTTP